jgi:DHA1 family bicyclomycin/chloramphenicol resistance-like MFS transporter
VNHKTRLILILGAIAAIAPLSIDLYLSSFPEIAKGLSTDIRYVSLTLTTYFIGIGIGQLANGPLLDRFGRKSPLLIGLGLFIISSLACGWAPNITMLLFWRVIMALGCSMGMVATRAVIRDHFEHNDIARALSAMTLVFGLAPVLAPLLGGYILQTLGWRFNFYFLALYGTFIIILVAAFLKESRGAQRHLSLKPKAVFKGYWYLLNQKLFMVYALAGCIGMMGMFAYISGLAYIVRDIMGYDEIVFAWIFGLNSIGYIAASQVNRFLLRRANMLVLTKRVALILGSIGLLILGQIIAGIPAEISFFASLFLFISMLGFINPNTQALALEPFVEQAGSASALVGAFRMTMGSMAAALLSIFHNGTALPLGLVMAGPSLLLIFILWNKNWAPATK